MKDIKFEEIIKRLIRDPRHDKEIGWNNALIALLKGESFEEVQISTYLEGIEFTPDEIRQMSEFKRKNERLNAVKFIKEKTGLGLKESKDKMEAIFDIPYVGN